MGHYDVGHYDTALVCTAGHMVNDCAGESPEHNTDHCDKCGSPAIRACVECDTPVRGWWFSDHIVYTTRTAPVPVFCHKCGKPYPWTVARLQAGADLLAEFDHLTDDDREHFAEALPDLLSDSPRSTVSAVRVKRLLTKAGDGAKEGLWEILKGVATAGASKLIWGA